MSGDGYTAPIDRFVFDVTAGDSTANVFFTWFRLVDEPPAGSTYTIPGGPTDGWPLVGGRVYSFGCALKCVTFRWGVSETWVAQRSVLVELGVGAPPSDTRTDPAPVPLTFLAFDRIDIPPFGGAESLKWSTVAIWRSILWDGVTFPKRGPWGNGFRQFAVTAYATSANRAFTLWLAAEHTAVGVPGVNLPLARAASQARPTGFHWANLCHECPTPSVIVGASIEAGAALSVYVELWASR